MTLARVVGIDTLQASDLSGVQTVRLISASQPEGRVIAHLSTLTSADGAVLRWERSGKATLSIVVTDIYDLGIYNRVARILGIDADTAN